MDENKIEVDDDGTTDDRSCALCDKKRKKIESRWYNATLCSNSEVIGSLKLMAIKLGELDIVSRIGENSKHIFYHK